jgi:hypothetical protein
MSRADAERMIDRARALLADGATTESLAEALKREFVRPAPREFTLADVESFAGDEP